MFKALPDLVYELVEPVLMALDKGLQIFSDRAWKTSGIQLDRTEIFGIHVNLRYRYIQFANAYGLTSVTSGNLSKEIENKTPVVVLKTFESGNSFNIFK